MIELSLWKIVGVYHVWEYTKYWRFYRFINAHALAVVHIMRDNCTVCHAVLPQIQDLLKDYPKAQLGVINQSNVEAIAGELSILQYLLI